MELEDEKHKSTMGVACRGILWLVFGGCSSLAYLVLALFFGATIVGLPACRELFHRAKIVAFPFDRTFKVSRGCKDFCECSGIRALLSAPYMVAGFFLAFWHSLLAIFLMLSVVGVPFAEQHHRLALLALKPLGVNGVEAEMSGCDNGATDALMPVGAAGPSYGDEVAPHGIPVPTAIPVADDPSAPPVAKQV